MLMSPLRYAVTRKSRAISALSPPRESFVPASTKPQRALLFHLGNVSRSRWNRGQSGRINRGTGKRIAAIIKYPRWRENTTRPAHILSVISAAISQSSNYPFRREKRIFSSLFSSRNRATILHFFLHPSKRCYLFPFLASRGARFINRDMDLIDIPDFYNSPSSRIMVGKVWDRWWSGLIRSAIIGVARNWMYRAITRGPNRHFGPINDMDSWLGDVRLRGSIRH